MDLATMTALFRHDAWANERMLNAASHLAHADIVRDLKSSHGSIRNTLTHIVWAEWIWLQRWRGIWSTLVFAPADFPDGRFVVTVGDEARYRLVGELRTPGSFLKGEAVVDMADAAAPVTIRLTPPPDPRR